MKPGQRHRCMATNDKMRRAPLTAEELRNIDEGGGKARGVNRFVNSSDKNDPDSRPNKRPTSRLRESAGEGQRITAQTHGPRDLAERFKRGQQHDKTFGAGVPGDVLWSNAAQTPGDYYPEPLPTPWSWQQQAPYLPSRPRPPPCPPPWTNCTTTTTTAKGTTISAPTTAARLISEAKFYSWQLPGHRQR